ncbi:hypothetical protein N7474_002862 [Penicillium riverlandense]|uniref:uncharacterized protein n=1 Tax=Penicillium riverlandense TaxID=1903569 RepID=UPI002547FE85|nr:uncharacterized protein N7474_002862 [Penicillium riverlandense]KAJ5825724.1 hypothetical protein N7474_002862 [Penicillium riverlandense]
MTEALTRLHITPLTPEILPSVLPASLRQSATDISFHSIPTFLENSYGYVTLPAMEAEKIKKKFNGSILKGKKFKVETARPQKRHRPDEEAGAENDSKKSKKRKSEDGVLDGIELPADRKVKRGWTESSTAKKERRMAEKDKEKKKSSKDKKDKTQAKSKYTEKPECLFRTKIPPNRSGDDAVDGKKAKKRKQSSQESVVHEFAKTVAQPSFLRDAKESAAPTATFEEGKGWVDATGEVKEPASEKIRKANYQPGKVAGAKEKRSAGSSKSKKKTPAKSEPSEESSSEDWTSSSGSSDESPDSESEDDTPSSSNASSASAAGETNAKPAVSSKQDVAGATETTQEPTQDERSDVPTHEAVTSAKEVHPLEALFKRAGPLASDVPAAPDASAGFSFFGNDDIESEEEEPRVTEPQTPYTKMDLQARGLRSAAPTPDTAMLGRRMKWNDFDEMEDEDQDDVNNTPVAKTRNLEAPQEDTEFVKWFWENRGENNRAWKKRRRDAAKEQRQRENRKKGLKGKS